jgi:MFS family permease
MMMSYPGTKELPQGAWRVVVFLFIVGVLNYIDRNMLTTMRSSIVESIPMSDAQFGMLTSMFLWIYGLLSPVAGYFADKFKRSPVIIISLIVWSVVTWMTGHATNYNQLLICRALMGISEAFYMPAALALITDYHKGPTQSLATGINLTGVMIGSSLGFIGGWVAESYHWGMAFNIFGVIGVVYAIVLFFFLKDVPGSKPTAEPIATDMKKKKDTILFSDALKNLFGNSTFIFLLAFWGILGLVNWIIVAWLPTYYKETFNLSQSIAGVYATAYFYPASIVGLLLGGFLADKWSQRNLRARVYVPLIGLIIATPCVFFGSITTLLSLAIVLFLVFGLTCKFSDSNMMPVLCLIADNRYRATGYGLLNMFSTIAGGIGVYIAGAMRDSQTDLSSVYQVSAFAIMACIVILFLVSRRVEKDAGK